MAPCRPPSISPIQISRTVSTANRIVVRKVFIHYPPFSRILRFKRAKASSTFANRTSRICVRSLQKSRGRLDSKNLCFSVKLAKEILMRLGVVFPQTEIGADPLVIRDFAQAAEALGYQHILAYDHVIGANIESRPGWQPPYTHRSMFHEPFVLFS